MRNTLIAAAAGLLALVANAPAQQLQPLAPAPDFGTEFGRGEDLEVVGQAGGVRGE